MNLTKTRNGDRYWHVMFKVTDKCNAECDHCIENGTKSSSSVMSIELVKKVMDDVARKVSKEDRTNVLFAVQGGEATLFPELCEGVVKYGHGLGCRVGVATNGWWGSDPKLIEKYLAMSFDNVGLSYDHWHAKFVPQQNVYNILDALRDHPTKAWLVSVVDPQNPPPKLPERFAEKIYVQQLPLKNAGRGLDVRYKGPRENTVKEGISVYWNGRVNNVCDWENYTATIGDARKDDCYELLQKKCANFSGRVCDSPCSGRWK